jgi:hypothetical protein
MISWKTHGALAPGRDNVMLYPTSYSAQHPDLEWLIGSDGVLDPTQWFIIILDMFGNGLSSSPSNTPGWPGLVTSFDNVHAKDGCWQSKGASKACTASMSGRWARSNPITGTPYFPNRSQGPSTYPWLKAVVQSGNSATKEDVLARIRHASDFR